MKGDYKTKGVKATGSSSKCTSGTSNTKKGTYASSEGPMKGYGNGFKNNAGGRRK
jgi:hypothetical protein